MKKQGFTIVEILVVIAILGILAALAYVGFGTWRTSVAEDQVKSDLNGVMTGMESALNWAEEGFPIFAEGTIFDSGNSTGDVFKNTEDVRLTYMWGDEEAYCIEATSLLNPSIIFFILAANGNKDVEPGTCPASPNKGVVSTVVNGGLNFPTGIAVDNANNLYVAETNNNRILKITQAGVVSVLAGSTTAGYVDATGTAARFDSPYGVTVDNAGIVYVADNDNNRIRKITPAGVVTTFAGSIPGFLNGTGTAAQFWAPYGIVINRVTGDLYVSETTDHRIRKITPGAVVSSFAGNGVGYVDATGTAARFDDPLGIALHADGNMFVVEWGNEKVRKVTAPGAVVTTIAGSTNGYQDGIGTAAKFDDATGIGIRRNIAYIADSGNNRVRMVNVNTGEVVTLAGSGVAGDVDAVGTGAQFSYPTGIAVGDDDAIYIVESLAGQIRRIK